MRTHHGLRAVVVLGVTAALVAGVLAVLKLSNGDFSGYYDVSGVFPRAGEGLHTGAEVVLRGVQVGRVTSIALDGTRARVTMAIEPSLRLPASATATIEPQNLFGADQVSLSDPSGGPSLRPGGTFARTATSPSFDQLFAAAAPLLSRIDTADLSTVVSELGQASAGEGPRIARSISVGARLASMLDSTLQAQLVALSSFTRFTGVLAAGAPSLNGISASANEAFPAFNRAVADYQRLLDNLTPFAEELATILSDYHPDIATLLVDGANIARVLVAHRSDIASLVHGLYEYAYTFAHGSNPEVLPNGTRFANFQVFVMFADVNQLVCSLIAPAQPGLAFLEPLQQALTGPGSPFHCGAELAKFAAAQSGTGTALPLAPVRSAAQQLANQAYGAIATPSVPKDAGIGSYIAMLLGGRP